jgi:hypothetical protein
MKKLRVISRASFRRNSDTQFVTPAMEVAIVTGLPSYTTFVRLLKSATASPGHT